MLSTYILSDIYPPAESLPRLQHLARVKVELHVNKCFAVREDLRLLHGVEDGARPPLAEDPPGERHVVLHAASCHCLEYQQPQLIAITAIASPSLSLTSC